MKGKLPDLKGLTSTFAETRTDHFHNGLDIASLNDPIYPVDDGKILYSRHASDDPYKPQIGPGNEIFIDHGKGWWSGYYHLKEFSNLREGTVKKNDIIGYTGNSGHSSGAHLHFFIIKNYGNVYINPLSVLPPATDNNPPVIGQIIIITPIGKTMISHSRPQEIRLTKNYPFLLNVIDPGMEKNTRRGLFHLKWKLNDQPEQSLNFNELLLSQKGWILSGGQSFEETYIHDLYNLGNLPVINGTNHLRVTASDFTGLSTTVEFNINVLKEF
ncbi:MAG: M23 family metallopeptidase [Spirochaetia bacterium]|nr:M23 family metallopeptidase [Spirochaetia bacterium]